MKDNEGKSYLNDKFYQDEKYPVRPGVWFYKALFNCKPKTLS